MGNQKFWWLGRRRKDILERIETLGNPWKMERWQVHYRSLLRECSYLPDPIAKRYMHDYIVSRFRKYVIQEKRPWVRYGFIRQTELFKESKETQQLLKRANEGYTRALEKVLRQAYGRQGRRRKELVCALIAPEIPANTEALKKVLQRPKPYGDDWRPPSIVMDLIKSQQNNSILSVQKLGQVKHLEPCIPRKATLANELAKSRRRNIRKAWYNDIIEQLLPPLSGPDLSTLEELISGKKLWTPPTRRVPVNSSWRQFMARKAEVKRLNRILRYGPKKGEAFRKFARGRPHVITGRFMQKLWRRILSAIPRMDWDSTTQKHCFTFDRVQLRSLGIPGARKLFDDVDSQGKVTSREQVPSEKLTIRYIY
ncbi:hypothetical protein BDV28DRAFT_142025, partial [Aspergillus coremiiformis]